MNKVTGHQMTFLIHTEGKNRTSRTGWELQLEALLEFTQHTSKQLNSQ